MALDKATLETELEAAFEDAVGASKADAAAAIADAIDKYVKTGSVVAVQPGGSTIPIT
jgi:hypothetical protein